MSGQGPSSPHTDDTDDSPSRFRDGRLLIAALVAIVVIAGAVVAFSWNGLQSASGDPEMPSFGDPINGRTSVPVQSLPPLSTVTATSQVPTEIGTSSTPRPRSTKSPTTTSRTSTRTPRRPAPKPTSTTATAKPDVEYQVVSDEQAVISYTSVSGKAWEYPLESGTWTITASGGGRITAKTLSGHGSISCRTRTKAGGKVVDEDSSSAGSAACRG